MMKNANQMYMCASRVFPCLNFSWLGKSKRALKPTFGSHVIRLLSLVLRELTLSVSWVSQLLYRAKKRNPTIGKIRLSFCIYKAWILVHTKPLHSNANLIAFWRNACILHDTG